MNEQLVLAEVAGPIATVTLNDPPMNPVSTRTLDALHAALDRVEAEPSVRCVIFTGAGERAFCAGGDLRQESQFQDPEAAKAFREYGRRTLNRLECFPKPIVAAIHGYCIGGGTALAWSCDLRIAADNTVFRAADAYLGLIPSWGMGLLRLPRFVGRNKAMDILLLGGNFGAEEAFAMGLVSRVVPAASLMAEARAAAERIAAASPTAILATRQAIQYGLRHSWDEMVRFEEELCERVFEHPDAKEGMAAFFEKRPPRFQDR
ncbi:enoyl-CoA hydratase/isomerase family protein [Azospirillum sp.]|uniref:enoyl-CoA hydratase/isomerase family protein n=1 Tax=Azospirillum sp. TaxID=34012 RepID=UPI003D75A706